MNVTDMERHLENLDRRLARVEQILPTLATREDLAALSTRMEVLYESNRHDIRLVAERVVTLTERLEFVPERVVLLTERLESVADAVVWLTKRVDGVAGGVAALGDRVEVLAGGVAALIERLERRGVI